MTVYCDKCGQELLPHQEVRMGSSKETARMVCPFCQKLWRKICDKLDEKYKDFNDEWGNAWEEEYAKFFGIVTKEKVQFT
jgi:hypothetical protein